MVMVTEGVVTKEWLFNQLDGVLKLNKDTRELISSFQNSLLPDIEKWIKESHVQIKNNNFFIMIIKSQLLRDFSDELSEEELKILSTI